MRRVQTFVNCGVLPPPHERRHPFFRLQWALVSVGQRSWGVTGDAWLGLAWRGHLPWPHQ